MNKLYSVVYSPKAKDDLKEIYTYIAFTLSVPTTAEKQINRIRKAIRSLDFMPLRNHPLIGSLGRVKECAKLQLTNSLLFIR